MKAVKLLKLIGLVAGVLPMVAHAALVVDDSGPFGGGPKPAAAGKSCVEGAVPSAPAPAAPNAAPPIAITKWTLSPAKSLRENLSDWSAMAGYKNFKWDVPGEYTVTQSQTVDGDFLSVMDKISEAANLDVVVGPSISTVYVKPKAAK